MCRMNSADLRSVRNPFVSWCWSLIVVKKLLWVCCQQISHCSEYKSVLLFCCCVVIPSEVSQKNVTFQPEEKKKNTFLQTESRRTRLSKHFYFRMISNARMELWGQQVTCTWHHFLLTHFTNQNKPEHQNQLHQIYFSIFQKRKLKIQTSLMRNRRVNKS